MNTKSLKNSSSPYKGVSWARVSKKWYACIKINGKSKNLGSYESEKHAALKYNTAAYLVQGKYAVYNKVIGI